jgi:opacity protein-like surface antigen
VSRRPDALALLVALAVGLVLSAAPACAQDRVRPYVGARVGLQGVVEPGVAADVEAARPQNAFGLSLGVDLTRHFGLELAGDVFEPELRLRSLGRSVGEIAMGTVIAHARLRYPLLGDRLVPYVLGGVGVGIAEFNDRKPPGFGRSIHASDTGLAWAAGGGVEYFIADNLAVGVDVRFVSLLGQDVEIDGQSRRADFDSVLGAAGMRLYLGDGPVRGIDAPTEGAWTPYVSARAGGARVVNRRISKSFTARTENARIAQDVNQAVGFSAGVDIGRFVAVELAADGYEFNLDMTGRGRIGEYAVYAFVPQVRVRYPLRDGRLLPMMVAGVGVGYAEYNDRKPPAVALDVDAEDFAVVGVVGGAVEYLVARNVGVSAEARYLISRGHTISAGGRSERLNLDTIVATLGLRLRFR